MKTVEVSVMWYESPGDGDVNDAEIEIEDEEYSLLRKYFRKNDVDDIHSEDIEDPEVRKIVERIEKEALDEFEENSADGYEMLEEDEEESEDFEEWYDRFTKEARLSWEEPEEHTFTINISNGGESELEFPVYEDEMELIEQADEESEEYGNVEGLEDFYKEIMEAARVKLEEDLDLTGDDIEMVVHIHL